MYPDAILRIKINSDCNMSNVNYVLIQSDASTVSGILGAHRADRCDVKLLIAHTFFCIKSLVNALFVNYNKWL